MSKQEWATVTPNFGSAMPYGSCNAVDAEGRICGYPRRKDGTCYAGHPKPPHRKRAER